MQIFISKGQWSKSHHVKVTGHKKLEKTCVVFTYRQQHQQIEHGRHWFIDCTLGLCHC